MTKSQSKKLKEIPKLLKAIKLRCLDCSAYSPNEVKLCVNFSCSLYPYRTGRLQQDKKLSQKFTKEKSLISEKNAILQASEVKK